MKLTAENKEKDMQIRDKSENTDAVYDTDSDESGAFSDKKPDNAADGKKPQTAADDKAQTDGETENNPVSQKKRNVFARFFSDNALVLAFVISLVADSLLLRLFTVGVGDSDLVKAVVKPMLADVASIIVIALFGYICRKQKSRFIYLMVWTVVFSILAAGNSIYYTQFKSFLSVSLISTASQLGGVMDAVTGNILEIKDWLFLFPIVVMIVIYAVVCKRHEKGYVKQKLPRKLCSLYAGIFAVIAVISGTWFSSMLTSTDCSRLVKQWNRESVMSSFGLYVYQISDTISSVSAKLNMVFGYEENKEHFDEFFASDTDGGAETETIASASGENSNEYTGIFEGKNVLVIHAESVQQFTMDTYINGEELTPNLNKLASEGLYFSNFYAQESVGTSSDSEFTFATSLMPASSGTVAINYWDRDYNTTQKAFGNMGYYVFSMHGNNGSFWNRLNLHSSLGYDRLYHYTTDFTIDETIGLGLSDKSFFAQAVPKIKEIDEENESWYGLLIMLTNHTPFTDIENVSDYDYDVSFTYTQYNEETGLYEEVTRDFLEGTKLGCYFKSVHYADEALGQLMDDLDEEGLLDDTVVIIYGDHDAKIKEEEYEYYYNYDPFTDETLDEDEEGYVPVDDFYYNINRRVPLIIWCKDADYEPQEITRVMGMYDVQPTLGNMFGYENEYALGHDIFSFEEGEENIVIFPSGNFVTDTVYYDIQKDTYFDLTDYDNVARYVSCNQVYKDDPVPVESDEITELFISAGTGYSESDAEARKNDGAVDDSYIDERSEYTAERIEISNAIIYYDMINKAVGGITDEITETNPSQDTDPFYPPDAIERKRRIAA